MNGRPHPASLASVRIAIYGVKSSGKTCILTALALPRVSHPERLTCVWVDKIPGHPLPQGNPEQWNTQDPYHLGWLLLSQCREKLRAGTIPDPTRLQDPLRYLYDFSSPERGKVRVELIDYSGELLEMDGGLAEKLARHMETCDGLLVLAEAPSPEHGLEPLSNDLETLKAAFTRLRSGGAEGPKKDWPIAIVINKWDRRIRYQEQKPEGAAADLRAFLEGTPNLPHCSLVDAVQNAVRDGLCKLFAASAFGDHERRPDGKEVPRVANGQLQSFGLEDPFLWLISQKDALAVSRYENAVGRLSWGCFWQTLSDLVPKVSWRAALGPSPFRLLSEGVALRRSLPDTSDLNRRVRHAFQIAWVTLAVQVIALLTLAVLLLEVSEVSYDAWGYRWIQASRANPNASVERLRTDESWLEHYYTSPWYRHCASRLFVLARESARQQLTEFRERRDESLWSAVAATKEPVLKPQLARSYLDEFPANGKHSSDARLIVQQAEMAARQRENDHALQVVQGDVDALLAAGAQSSEAIVELRRRVDTLPPHREQETDGYFQMRVQLRRRLTDRLTRVLEADAAAKHGENDKQLTFWENRSKRIEALEDLEGLGKAMASGLPYPDHISDPLKKRLTDLQADVGRRTLVVRDSKRWQDFERQYRDLMAESDVRSAVQHLVTWKPRRSEVDQLEADFRQRAPLLVEKEVDKNINVCLWKDARKCVRDLQDELHGPAAALLGEPELTMLQSLLNRINRREDEHLYKQARESKHDRPRHLQAYLTTSPLKTMAKEVEEYQRYLAKRGGKLALTLHLKEVRWDGTYYSNYYSYANDITVKLTKQGDNGELLNLGVNGIISKANGSSTDAGEKEFPAMLSDPVTLTVDVVARYGTLSRGYTMKGGSGTNTISVEALNGLSLDLAGDGFKNRATFTLSGIPTEPSLPAWREK